MKKHQLINSVFATVLVIVLTSCGKSTTDKQDQNNVFQNCSNCSSFSPQGSGNEVFNSSSKDSSGLLNLNLVLMAQYLNTNSNPYFSGHILNSYRGLLAATGGAVLIQNFSQNFGQNNGGNSFCLMPAGNYKITTVEAGQWQDGGLVNLRLRLDGPSQVVMSVIRAQLSTGSNTINYAGTNLTSSSGRLVGSGLIESINGTTCQFILNLL